MISSKYFYTRGSWKSPTASTIEQLPSVYKYVGFSKSGNRKGRTKYAVVGLDKDTGEITIYHIKDIENMHVWDSSLGITP